MASLSRSTSARNDRASPHPRGALRFSRRRGVGLKRLSSAPHQTPTQRNPDVPFVTTLELARGSSDTVRALSRSRSSRFTLHQSELLACTRRLPARMSRIAFDFIDELDASKSPGN